MKLLAITALFIAGALALPANSCYQPPPPPPPYDDGGDNGGGDGGYPGVPSHHYPPPPPPPPPPPYNGVDYPQPPNGGNDGHHRGGDGDRDHGYGNDGDGNAGSGGYNPCTSDLYSTPQCCGTNVLGVLGLGCDAPSKAPSNAKEFGEICQKDGGKAQCCGISLGDIASILCQDVPAN